MWKVVNNTATNVDAAKEDWDESGMTVSLRFGTIEIVLLTVSKKSLVF